METKYTVVDMYDVQTKYHAVKGIEGRWFSPSNMSFFKCRLPQDAYLTNGENRRYYFITSERMLDDKRTYTIRTMDMAGNINNLGELGKYSSKGKAKRELINFLKDSTK